MKLIVASGLVSGALALGGCASDDPDRSDPEAVATAFMALVLDGDERACDLTTSTARGQITSLTGTGSCADAVHSPQMLPMVLGVKDATELEGLPMERKSQFGGERFKLKPSPRSTLYLDVVEAGDEWYVTTIGRGMIELFRGHESE